MENTFFEANRQNLLKSVQDSSIAILFAGRAPYKSADETYEFAPNKNFYYMTGITRENIILVMTKRNTKEENILYIEKEDPVMARWVGEKMTSTEARKLSGIQNIRYTDSFYSDIAEMIGRYEYKNIYLDLERAEWNIPLSISEDFAKKVKEKYPSINIIDLYHRISELRMVKDESEIASIKRAIEITREGLKKMMKNAKPGMTEQEIEAYFDFTLTSHGVKEKAFKTIAASGKNGTVLHYSQNNSLTHERDLILFDLGATYDCYNADISRTFPVNGKFTPRQKQIYNIVLKANLAVIDALKPGVTNREINAVAGRILADGLKEIGLIKNDSELLKYYFHSVDHYLGLDTHDVGNYDVPFRPGTVITDEPGLYIPEEGIGVRIEDDLLVTENGCEVLSKDIIKTTEEIENFMSK